MYPQRPARRSYDDPRATTENQSLPVENQTHLPTRAAGLSQLAAFVPKAGRQYEAKRNYDLGPDARSNVSLLSPYIRHRLVSEEEVLAAVLGRHSFAAAEKFIQEVFWRTYFKGYLEARPIIWAQYRAAVSRGADDLVRNAGLRKAYSQATLGETGIDCFDAWVPELNETGYLHNHARMWFASIWIFTLRLPWQLGADFMYRHLLDGDAASNTLSWRWVAGLHTRGKTYLARADNIHTYTEGRFNPAGLAHEAVALDEDDTPKAAPLPAAAANYPNGRLGLLLSEDDLHPELPDPGLTEIVAVAGGVAPEARSLLPVSQPVISFTAGALDDGLAETARRLNVDATHLASLTAESITQWARANTLATIAMPYAPVGPFAERLPQLTRDLQLNGIALVQVRRAYDTLAWRSCTRGFFAVKEKIPAILTAVGLDTGKLAPQPDLFTAASH